VLKLGVLDGFPGLVWAGLRLTDGGRSSAGLPADDPGVAHVHGLGVNPADGSLYVATHHGTFRLESSKDARRVGSSYQDTMGFTVAGPDQFLGSGHPDLQGLRRGQPTRLGLIESTDGGVTWRDVSLGGEVDFHGLAFAHDRVYGWDSGSGRFMVSADRRTWDTRSALPLASFAVDPDDAEHIVGAGPEGLVASRDGGRTWSPTPGPALAVLSWDGTAGLAGATPAGDVYRSGDRGATWAPAGRLPGPPQALLATATTWYAAADEGGATGIYRSTDSGRTWTLYYRDSR
jgi:photosystem II stability/assembly factor-like uncharacterized protein